MNRSGGGPIVKVDRHAARTCFKIATAGCDSRLLKKENVDIVLSRCGLGRLVCDVRPVDVGCGSTMPFKRWIRVGAPRLRYCAFSTDPNGAICFLWDNKFLDAEPGVWIGELRLCEKPIAIITFHLGERFQVLEANSVPVDVCDPCEQ